MKFGSDLIEQFDVKRTMGNLNFLEVEPNIRFEETLDEDGNSKSVPTGEISGYTAILGSDAGFGKVEVTLPETTDISALTDDQYMKPVELVNATVRLWASKDSNGRRTSGTKFYADSLRFPGMKQNPKQENKE